jgi:hypothetical protein
VAKQANFESVASTMSLSQSSRNSGKRNADCSIERPFPKRSEFNSEINKAVEDLQEFFPLLKEFIRHQMISSDEDRNANLAVLVSWRTVCALAQKADTVWTTPKMALFNDRLPNSKFLTL